MFDATVLAKAVLVGALAAVATMRLIAWVPSRAAWRSASWSWAVGAGIVAASGATDQWPHWPALEDRARFLGVLVPLTLTVETLAAITRSGRVAWLMRAGLVALVTPILLHNTVYLTTLDGRSAAEWSTFQAMVILFGLAAVLTLLWAALSALASRTSSLAVYWMLILDALATAVTVMLSGYYRAGLLGLGLAGAMTGAALSAHTLRFPLSARASTGMGVIGVFTVVLMGRFFGTLPDGLAACLLFAPCLAWLVELPRLRDSAPIWRATRRLTCVSLPLIVAIVIAQQRFVASSAATSRQAMPVVHSLQK